MDKNYLFVAIERFESKQRERENENKNEWYITISIYMVATTVKKGSEKKVTSSLSSAENRKEGVGSG